MNRVLKLFQNFGFVEILNLIDELTTKRSKVQCLLILMCRQVRRQIRN